MNLFKLSLLLICTISTSLFANEGDDTVSLKVGILGTWEVRMMYEDGELQPVDHVERFRIRFEKKGTVAMLGAEDMYSAYEEVIRYRVDGNRLFVDGDSLVAEVRGDTLIVTEKPEKIYFVRVK